jgi:hypothetical protein
MYKRDIGAVVAVAVGGLFWEVQPSLRLMLEEPEGQLVTAITASFDPHSDGSWKQRFILRPKSMLMSDLHLHGH